MSEKQEDMVYTRTPDELSMSTGEAMFTQRAIRRFRHDKPISDADIQILLDAAAKAPNGGNTQPARFLVIRNPSLINDFGKLYHEAWWAKRRDDSGWAGPQDIPEGSIFRWAALLADEMSRAPLVILALSVPGSGHGSSVFPAVQNLLLAARSLGIGSVLTTLHDDVMERVYAMFGLPPDMIFHCCLPLGYPRGHFGPTRRFPTSMTTSWDRWGNSPPWQ
jgi:nitroreductase